jgi:SPOR domain
MVRPQDVAARVARFAAKGQPVYALRQADGTVRLYFGAYANTEQATLALPQVREAGLVPTLVYRIGRVF